MRFETRHDIGDIVYVIKNEKYKCWMYIDYISIETDGDTVLVCYKGVTDDAGIIGCAYDNECFKNKEEYENSYNKNSGMADSVH